MEKQLDKNMQDILQSMIDSQKQYFDRQKQLYPDLGEPLYKINDLVEIKPIRYGDKDITEGVVLIVDKYGAFEIEGDHSYDIFNKEANLLLKHVAQKSVIRKIRESTTEERPIDW